MSTLDKQMMIKTKRSHFRNVIVEKAKTEKF